MTLRKGEPCTRQSCPDLKPDALDCGNCPNAWLENAQRSGSASLLRRALDTEFALRQHVQIRLAEIPADEWEALKLIDAERAKFQKEEERKRKT